MISKERLDHIRQRYQTDSLSLNYGIDSYVSYVGELLAEVARMQALVESLAARVAGQSELLSKRSERDG